VDEPHTAVDDFQEPGGDGLVKPGPVVDHGGGDQLDGRGRGDRRHRQRPLRLRGERGDPARGHGQHTVRERHRIVGERPAAVPLHRPSQLDGRERVARGQVVDATHRPSGQVRGVVAEQRVEVGDAERTEHEMPEARGAVEPEWQRQISVRPARHEDADGLVRQPAGDVAQHPLRCPVDPVDVVDRQQEWPLLGEGTQKAEHRDAHRVLVGHRTGFVRAQQREVERVPLRRRERGRRRAVNGVEQVPQRYERQVDLGVDGGRGNDPVPPLHRRGDEVSRQRRLADACGPFDEQRRRAGREFVEELGGDEELVRAADERRPPAGQHGRSPAVPRTPRPGTPENSSPTRSSRQVARSLLARRSTMR
jgi:hypothetical protein